MAQVRRDRKKHCVLCLIGSRSAISKGGSKEEAGRFRVTPNTGGGGKFRPWLRGPVPTMRWAIGWACVRGGSAKRSGK